jgi:predicted  nucleic acid-binding Zn-ribbon protein
MTNRPENAPNDMEALLSRFKRLDEQKIRADQNWKHSREKLEELKREALDAYGTDDLTKLRALLAEMEAENDRKKREYAEHLAEIERKLAEIERNQSAQRENG